MTNSVEMHAAPKSLVEVQRLDQPTFHALYLCVPACSWIRSRS
jgi:hypothetical protein